MVTYTKYDILPLLNNIDIHIDDKLKFENNVLHILNTSNNNSQMLNHLHHISNNTNSSYKGQLLLNSLETLSVLQSTNRAPILKAISKAHSKIGRSTLRVLDILKENNRRPSIHKKVLNTLQLGQKDYSSFLEELHKF